MKKIKKLNLTKEVIDRERDLKRGLSRQYSIVDQTPYVLECKINEIIDALNELVKEKDK